MATQIVNYIAGTPITLGTNSNTYTWTLKNTANGAYDQSPKIDFTANLPVAVQVRMSHKFASAPAAGTFVRLWIGYSSSATAGTDNPGNCTGADAAYTGWSGGTAAQSVLQLHFVGQMLLDVNVGAQLSPTFEIAPANRYAVLVLQNGSGVAFTNVDADHVVTLTPLNLRIEAPV
jgi:hypothetical protein